MVFEMEKVYLDLVNLAKLDVKDPNKRTGYALRYDLIHDFILYYFDWRKLYNNFLKKRGNKFVYKETKPELRVDTDDILKETQNQAFVEWYSNTYRRLDGFLAHQRSAKNLRKEIITDKIVSQCYPEYLLVSTDETCPEIEEIIRLRMQGYVYEEIRYITGIKFYQIQKLLETFDKSSIVTL